ncbi:hypothetical protein [Pseudarthrobacter sulfonivorans]|uniref:hypothetical protein n=1 Tax=Pseudarthrobacter sulfonivorans TaxID=121292 RepID=UPI00278151BB|nr:hypothetical protein [Pseudarthrobacter sulfonivorans]MDP9998480.1 hypothetical protein [Pseudarthrobacter sulfonivorans]
MQTANLTRHPLASYLPRGWQHLSAPAKLLAAVGLLMAASAAFHAVVFFQSGTAWEGPVSWRKPITFGLSLALAAVTLALIESRLRLRPVVSWLLLGALSAAFVLEAFLVTLQAWRGVPSHFNTATPFDSLVFSAMGMTVAVIVVVIVGLAVLSFTSAKPGAPALTLAIRAGLMLLVAGQVLGVAIIVVGESAALSGNEAAVFGPEGVVLGAAGILKSPHGIALHAIQVLPLLGWLVQRSAWSEARRRSAVWSAAAGYTVVLAVSVFQAYTGQAQFALSIAALSAALAGVLLVVVPYVQAIRSVGRRKSDGNLTGLR